jgi:hypothetical protein
MIQRIETADGKPAKNLKVGDAINADIGAARDFTATVLVRLPLLFHPCTNSSPHFSSLSRHLLKER